MTSQARPTIIADIRVITRMTVISATPFSRRWLDTKVLLVALQSNWLASTCTELGVLVKKIQAADAERRLQNGPKISLVHAVGTFGSGKQGNINVAHVRNLRERGAGDIGGDRRRRGPGVQNVVDELHVFDAVANGLRRP